MCQIKKVGYYYWNSAKEVVTKKLKPQPQGSYPVIRHFPRPFTSPLFQVAISQPPFFLNFITSFSLPSLLMSLLSSQEKNRSNQRTTTSTHQHSLPTRPPASVLLYPAVPPISVNQLRVCINAQLFHYALIPPPCTYSNAPLQRASPLPSASPTPIFLWLLSNQHTNKQ